MKKGLIGMAIAVVLVITAVATSVGLMWFAEEMSSKITIEVGFNERLLMEDKMKFDSEKHFLENSLLVAGAYAAYKNGENGTIYNDPWTICSGTDLDGNAYSYTCWKDVTDGDMIPPENQAVNEIFERTEDTFQDYFSELQYTEIKEDPLTGLPDITPLEMENDRNEFNFSYKITELNLSSTFLNHTMKGKDTWVNTTIPIRYTMLRGNGSDFTQNSVARLNTKLVSALNSVTVCNGGKLTEDGAETEIEKELQNIAIFESGAYGGDFEWEMHLLEINYFDEDHPDYEIEFTINVTVRDSDLERRVTTVDSLEKLGITFAINARITFTRAVTYVCSGSPGVCGNPGHSCLGGTICEYYKDCGSRGNCAVKNCHSRETPPCDCVAGGTEKCTATGCKALPPPCSGQTTNQKFCECENKGFCSFFPSWSCIGCYDCADCLLDCCCCKERCQSGYICVAIGICAGGPGCDRTQEIYGCEIGDCCCG